MAELEFNTPAGQTIDRELLIAYLNIGTPAAPDWEPLGLRVSDSSMEFDMSKKTEQDIIGNTFTTMKKPVITQTFDPMPLDASDAAAVHIWNLGVYNQNVQALASQDVMVAHFYATSGEAKFAERYPQSAIEITNLGGEGGGTLGMSTTITYGGTRALGTVTKDSSGKVAFNVAAA